MRQRYCSWLVISSKIVIEFSFVISKMMKQRVKFSFCFLLNNYNEPIFFFSLFGGLHSHQGVVLLKRLLDGEVRPSTDSIGSVLNTLP